MIARGFKSVIWVATVGSAALGCYMVSLRVATERNELAKVERQIIAAKRDIRSLQTELGTRGRMTQLEQWNAEVLALSAPSSAQFLKDEFTLARLYRNDPTVEERAAEVRLASADTGAAKAGGTPKAATPPVVQAVAERPAAQAPMIHRASFTTGEAPAKAKPAPAQPERVRTAAATAGTDKPVKPAAAKTASVAQPKPDRSAAKPSDNAPKPAAQRTASASAKPESGNSRPAAKPSAKPAAKGETLRTAAAKPAREAAPRSAKVKGGGGN
ncbi:MAG TPA: hypothetical protein VF547_06545 [Allosphingosinicella sp.]